MSSRSGECHNQKFTKRAKFLIAQRENTAEQVGAIALAPIAPATVGTTVSEI
ncbi:MAG: hypothetical protein WDM70_00250 [Nitrosomonadales bacterium]